MKNKLSIFFGLFLQCFPHFCKVFTFNQISECLWMFSIKKMIFKLMKGSSNVNICYFSGINNFWTLESRSMVSKMKGKVRIERYK